MEKVVAKQGKVLKEHPPFIMFVSILGLKFRDASTCEVAYKDKIEVEAVHFIGSKDRLRLPSEELATAFHDLLIPRPHPQLYETTEQLYNRMAAILVQSKGAICTGERDEPISVEETMKVDDEEETLKMFRKQIINTNSIDASEFTRNQEKPQVFQNKINSQTNAPEETW